MQELSPLRMPKRAKSLQFQTRKFKEDEFLIKLFKKKQVYLLRQKLETATTFNLQKLFLERFKVKVLSMED